MTAGVDVCAPPIVFLKVARFSNVFLRWSRVPAADSVVFRIVASMHERIPDRQRTGRLQIALRVESDTL
jgi:hypothetical protein